MKIYPRIIVEPKIQINLNELRNLSVNRNFPILEAINILLMKKGSNKLASEVYAIVNEHTLKTEYYFYPKILNKIVEVK